MAFLDNRLFAGDVLELLARLTDQFVAVGQHEDFAVIEHLFGVAHKKLRFFPTQWPAQGRRCVVRWRVPCGRRPWLRSGMASNAQR